MTTDLWTRLWMSRLAAIAAGDDRPPASSSTSPEAFAEWNAGQPKRLSDLFSAAWPGDDFEAWRDEIITSSLPRPLRRDLEMIVATALLTAWERGLRRVVVLPVNGEFLEVVGPEVLVVSQSIREDAHQYASILEEFTSG